MAAQAAEGLQTALRTLATADENFKAGRLDQTEFDEIVTASKLLKARCLAAMMAPEAQPQVQRPFPAAAAAAAAEAGGREPLPKGLPRRRDLLDYLEAGQAPEAYVAKLVLDDAGKAWPSLHKNSSALHDAIWRQLVAFTPARNGDHELRNRTEKKLKELMSKACFCISRLVSTLRPAAAGEQQQVPRVR